MTRCLAVQSGYLEPHSVDQYPSLPVLGGSLRCGSVNPTRLKTAVLLTLCPMLWAQSHDELVMHRNQRLSYSQLLQVKAGVMGSRAKDSDPAAGLDDEVAIDGSVFYHDESFGGRDGQFDAYAGRDGMVASIRDGRIVGNDTSSRLQLSARVWPFYREGFYRGDSFVPVGQYEGSDYEAYLGFGREAAQDLFVEFGPFYRRNSFDRNERTELSYTVPDDYAAYGSRVYIEQHTVQLDRRTRAPRGGYLFTVVLEREWNRSSGEFGTTPGFTSELPSAVWRGRGRMEWYIPQGSDSAWEIFATAALTDETDRVVNYDASHPQGHMWADAQLRYRLPFGDSFTLSPFVAGQFARILEEDGIGSDEKFFYGGGAEAYLHFSDAVSINAWYSYLNNESRPSVSIKQDLHGEHMFYAGIVLRFGGNRR